MPKLTMTIAQRVDLLLEHGVDNPKKWMSIHGYSEPKQKLDDDGHFDKVHYDMLREHHLDETACLFDIIRELTSRVKSK